MMRIGTDNPATRRAIGLLELIAVLAVLAILAVSLASAMPRMVIASRVRDTLHDMRLIHRAIMGDDAHGDYGYVGDMGCPPYKVSHLVRPSSNTILYHTDTQYSVGMGWKGPYLSGTISPDPTLDAFKTPYRILKDDGGRIHSAGPDGLFDTDDDLFFPEGPVSVAGPVRIELSAPGNFTVRLYYSYFGSEERDEDHKAPYIFKDVYRGPHAVEVWRVEKGDRAKLVRRTVIMTNGQGGVYRINVGDDHGRHDHDNDKKHHDKDDRDKNRGDHHDDHRGGGHRP